MTGMDGLELLKHVRANFPQLPMLLITAYASISASVEAIQNGAIDYLVKPFKPHQLVETRPRRSARLRPDPRRSVLRSETLTDE